MDPSQEAVAGWLTARRTIGLASGSAILKLPCFHARLPCGVWGTVIRRDLARSRIAPCQNHLIYITYL